MHLSRNTIYIILILFLVPGYAVTQNQYTPPDPYTMNGSGQHFTKYMIINPAFLGPNGLPVPYIHEGRNPVKFDLEMKYEYYFQDREQTHDALIRMAIPVSEGKVALEFKYVPFEFYEVDESLSRERRTESGEYLFGSSFGDLYFGTSVQLARDHTWLPDILISMSCKTASGTRVEDARHTDAPAYYFDLSAGKSYSFGKEDSKYFRWYLSGGFYAWQTYLDDFPQNDALFYGFGAKLDLKAIYINTSLRGLSGYMFNGDQPVVHYTEIGAREGRTAFTIGYEWGIIDYPFNCLRIGFKIEGLAE